MKSAAPSFIASTAVLTVPYAVTTMTGVCGESLFTPLRTSIPLVLGILTSVITAENPARLELAKGLRSAFRVLDFIAATGKTFRQHRSHGWFVIDEQNLHFLHHASRARKGIRFPCCRTAQHRFPIHRLTGHVVIVTPTIPCSVHSKGHPLSRHRSSSRQMHHQQSPQPLLRQTSSRLVRDC